MPRIMVNLRWGDLPPAVAAWPPMIMAPIAGRLAFFYSTVFAASFGVFLPYLPVWLESRGLSAGEIGLVLGASFWPRVLTNLMVPLMAEKQGKNIGAAD